MFLAAWALPLLVVHALLGFALLGASTHGAIVSVQLLRGAQNCERRARTYATLTALLLLACFVLGLLMYPHYRYDVRALHLDREAPWASNLFDLKENLAAFAVALGVPLWVIGRRLEPSVVPLHAVLSISICALTLLASVMGLLVTNAKGV